MFLAIVFFWPPSPGTPGEGWGEGIFTLTLTQPGIRHEDTHAVTHSILMRAKHQTCRYIKAVHNLDSKTIRLRSDASNHAL